MTKPKIGISMLHCLGKPFKEMLKQLAKTQTTYIEIIDDGLHTLNKQRVSTLRSLARSLDLEYSVHAPFADINIASPSKPILNTTLRQLKKSIAYAHELNAYLWIFHPGMKTGISSFYPEKDWHQNLKTVKTLLRTANEYKVKIAIENVPEPYPFLMKNIHDFEKFYEEIGGDVGLTLDVGHANINKQTDLFLTTFKHQIVHMHLSDNDGISDQHLGIGSGTVDWKNLVDHLRKTAYNGTLIIESIEHTEESLKKLKQLFA
jgi:sugar phosphate isomerase/epimerase